MIDPDSPAIFHEDEHKLQEFLLFGIMVAGKPADRTAKLVDRMLSLVTGSYSPFQKLQILDGPSSLSSLSSFSPSSGIDRALRKLRTGQYRKLTKAFHYIIYNLELLEARGLRSLSVEELEQIPGVGYKTSRYFKLYTDPGCQNIPLDTHLLKLLRALGYDAPVATPSSLKRYKKQEARLVNIFNSSSFNRLYEFDLAIWTAYSSRDEKKINNLLKEFKQLC